MVIGSPKPTSLQHVTNMPLHLDIKHTTSYEESPVKVCASSPAHHPRYIHGTASLYPTYPMLTPPHETAIMPAGVDFTRLWISDEGPQFREASSMRHGGHFDRPERHLDRSRSNMHRTPMRRLSSLHMPVDIDAAQSLDTQHVGSRRHARPVTGMTYTRVPRRLMTESDTFHAPSRRSTSVLVYLWCMVRRKGHTKYTEPT